MRKMTWALWIWSALIVVWAIAGGSSAANKCAHSAYQNACNAGAGIGVGVILFVGFIGFVFLSLIWFMTKPHPRECPVCGMEIRRGATICVHCETDFLEPETAATLTRQSSARS